ncbi:hypothetical protein TELCIR_15340, partial [Teladorsagia circumcincta]
AAIGGESVAVVAALMFCTNHFACFDPDNRKPNLMSPAKEMRRVLNELANSVCDDLEDSLDLRRRGEHTVENEFGTLYVIDKAVSKM